MSEEGKKHLKFPVSYELRVIMETVESDQMNIEAIEGVLTELKIPYKDWTHRKSKEGKYTSYAVKVMVKDQETFSALYEGLHRLPGIKHAI